MERGNELPDPQSQAVVSLRDLWIVFLFASIGLLSRIWALHQPSQPTIQEHHYGTLLNSFGDRDNIVVDNQPPLWQLIMHFYASFSEYRRNIRFEQADSVYNEKIYPTLRFINACLAGFVPVMTYITLRVYGVSLYISITGAMMIFCETSLIAEGRLISIEGAYQFFASLLILAVTLSGKGRFRLVSLLFTGVCYGLLLSTKFEGIYFLPFIVTLYFTNSREQINRKLLPGASVRVKQQLQRTVAALIPVVVIAIATFYSVMKLYLSMFSLSNENITAMIWNQTKLSWSKKCGVERDIRYRVNPFSLLFGYVPMYVMWRDENLNFSTHINWFNAIASLVSVISCFVLSYRSGMAKAKALPFACGYVFYYLCIVLETKPLFSHDFGICLIFGILTVGTFLEWSLPKATSGFLATVAVFLVFCGFVLWAPWAYGLPGARMETRVLCDIWY